MATVTLARFRELLARATGSYIAGTADSGSTTTVVDATTKGAIGQYDTRRLVNHWLYIVTDAGSAAPEGEARRITSVSSNTITVTVVFTAATAVGDTYEVLPFHPLDMNDAIQEAIRLVYPDLYLPIRDESLKVDNLLSNWDFESFTVSNVPDSWTEVGNPTTTEETTRVFQGTSSLKAAPIAIDSGYSQALFTGVNVQDIAGKSIELSCRGWSDGATGMKMRLSFDGASTYTDSLNHSGSSEWEKLLVQTTVPSTATSATAYLWNGTSGTTTVYWDDADCRVEGITRYTIPTTFTKHPARISQAADCDDPNGRYDPITQTNLALSGRILRLEGMGRFTVPTADTSTILVDETQAELVIAMAARTLFNRLISQDPADKDLHTERRDYWSGEVGRLKSQSGVRMRAMPAVPSHGAVRFAEDATARYLELVR